MWWKLDLPDDDLQSLAQELVAEHALPFFARFNSRDAVLDAFHAGDAAVRYTPKFTVAVIHARRGETAEAEELLAAELRETDRPPARHAILDAAEHLGLSVGAN